MVLCVYFKSEMWRFIWQILILFFLVSGVWSSPEGKIVSVIVQKNLLTVKTTGGQIKAKSFILDTDLKDIKRYVLDFENANLTNQSILDSENLKPCSARISQFSIKPLVTRLVITGPQEQIDSFKIINNINSNNTIKISFNSKENHLIKLPSALNYNLIQNINWSEEGLKIEGSKAISVSKTQISDKKIVFDLLNASLAKKSLSGIIKNTQNKTTEEVRIAQFQPKIVRVVIEGPTALNWKYKNASEKLIIFPDNNSEKEKNSSNNIIVEEKAAVDYIKISGDNPVQIEIKSFNKDPIKYKTFRLHSPERLVLDLYNWNNTQNIIPKEYPKSLIINIRSSRLTKSSKQLRIVFDLSQKGVSIEDKLDENKQNLIFNLNPLLSESMQASLKELRKVRSGLKVVIDAGHGGYDAGAIYSGVEEKNITLAMTKQLKEILLASKIEVVETRKNDQFISLDERVNITRKAQPDLFVSLHCNALQSSSNIKGIETYYFTPQSRALANVLHKKVVHYTQAPDRQVRKARFVVIRETAIPSVLVETGFLSNPSERDKLIDKDYQANIVKAVAEGILEYLSDSKASRTATLNPK